LVDRVRLTILEHLMKNPRPGTSKSSYWTGTQIAKILDMGESTVWKVVDRFAKYGAVEPKPTTRGNLQQSSSGMRTTRTFRAGIPVRLTPLGRRLAELMHFADANGIFKIGPQPKMLSENPTLLGRFMQGGFSKDEVKAAIDSGLIYEEKEPTYTPLQGLATKDMIGGPRLEISEYRYKYSIG
jgi:hypothetical protein